MIAKRIIQINIRMKCYLFDVTYFYPLMDTMDEILPYANFVLILLKNVTIDDTNFMSIYSHYRLW